MSPDSRGVLLGQRGVALFASLDRLVGFLRAWSDEGSLDELLPSLSLRRIVTRLRTRELMLSVEAESSYRMDRIAAIAKMVQGLVFTGTARHFVQYRDATSPLGYDIEQMVEEPADVVLYHDTFEQTYQLEAEIGFADLVSKLVPRPRPDLAKQVPKRLFVTAEVGVGFALIGYLFRWRIEARAAMAEWAQASAFEDAPRRLHVFDAVELPERIARVLARLPGVHLYALLGETLAVEWGHEHPIALESCGSLFPPDTLHLFKADGELLRVTPLPSFVSVRSLVRTSISPATSSPPVGTGAASALQIELPLRLAPTMAPWRDVVATVVGSDHRDWLARILYTLPPRVLSALRIARTQNNYYLLSPDGIEGVPLGTYYCAVAPKVYVPAGLTIVPAVAPAVLADLVRTRDGGHVFFEPDGVARVVRDDAFASASLRAIKPYSLVDIDAEVSPSAEPLLPLFQYRV